MTWLIYTDKAYCQANVQVENFRLTIMVFVFVSLRLANLNWFVIVTRLYLVDFTYFIFGNIYWE